MIPVFQTQFVAEHGKGNCFQAAIASVLDVSLDDVPAFRDLPSQDWDSAIDRFLFSRGLRRIQVKLSEGFEWGDAWFEDSVWHPGGECFVSGPPVILVGKSPRSDTRHAVVGRLLSGGGWKVLHDPHPDGTGIAGEPKQIHWLIPINTNQDGAAIPNPAH